VWLTVDLQNVLILLALLQLKHMFADFYLQTPRMLTGRGRYLHVGRAQHAAIHAAGSVIVLLVMGVSAPLTLIISGIEGVAHYHIDWGKGRYSDLTGDGPSDAGYWRAVGFDQALHQLTYVVMIWAWAVYAQG
jgi:hypothetical protein